MVAHPRCALAFLGTALLALSPRTAGADPIRVLDEATFVAQLKARSPRLHAAAARVAAAAAAVDAASVLPNPSLSWEREAVPDLDAADDFFRLLVPVDISGRRGLAQRAARREAEAARADAGRAGLILEIEGRRAYATASSLRQRVAELEASRVRLAELVATLRTRAGSGDAAEYDAERVGFELDLLDDELLTARRQLAAVQVSLGGMLGDAQQAIAAKDEVRLPAPHPLPSPSSAPEPRRDDVAAARHRAQASRLEARQARRGWIPRLELGLGLLRATATSTELGYLVTVGGELPVLDHGGAAARRAEGHAAMWDHEAAALTAEAAAEVARARGELTAATEQARRFGQGPAQRATALTHGAEVAYREGDRSIIELLDALRAQRLAQARSRELVLEARLAELELWQANGRTP